MVCCVDFEAAAAVVVGQEHSNTAVGVDTAAAKENQFETVVEAEAVVVVDAVAVVAKVVVAAVAGED